MALAHIRPLITRINHDHEHISGVEMRKVIIGEDCGNAPKNICLQKLTIAFANVDSKYIVSNVTDNFRWKIVREKLIRGKEHLARALEQAKSDKAAELTIHHVSTHGKSGAVNGTKKWKNGKTQAFCDVYEFKDTKGSSVREIASYVIEIK
jgi:hypothetical protein